MTSTSHQPTATRAPLAAGLCFFILLAAVELLVVLRLNDGLLTYTLDDPYIHLAMAENLRHGHYGVNADEVSSPSSSIAWPFLLIPCAALAASPFAINLVCALITVLLFGRIVATVLPLDDRAAGAAVTATTLVLLILGTNLVGLVFSGMEHSLQVLLVVLVAWGLVSESRTGRAPWWLVLAVAAAPLARYENLAVSAAAILYLLLRRRTGLAAAAAVLTALPVAAFSLYLVRLGLEPLPTSVIAKSYVMETGGAFPAIIGNLLHNLENVRTIVMCIGTGGLLVFALRDRTGGWVRPLAAAAGLAVVLHLLAGKHGWLDRYEVYIWTFFLLAAMAILGDTASHLRGRRSAAALAAGFGLFIVATSFSYLQGLITLPVACNNIYAQQYQMHRFATDYYNKPVAVNDLGYVAYGNANPVLDLRGLASKTALLHRRHKDPPGWMSELAARRDVDLAMIYDTWFYAIPDDWIKVGELRMQGPIIIVEGAVSFYAADPDAQQDIARALDTFLPTLPAGVEFTRASTAPRTP